MGLAQFVKSTFLQQIKVCRRIGDAGDWDPGVDFDIFTVNGDAILVFNLWGIVTTTMGAGAATPRFAFNPTGAAPEINISNTITDISGIQEPNIFVWDGVTATVPAPGAQRGWADSAEAGWNGDPAILPAGVILITNGTACNAGVVDFYIAYLPCSNASNVQAA